MSSFNVRRFRKSLRRFERLINRRLKHDTCCQGVSLAQCHVILEINDNEQATVRDLSESLGLDKSTVSRTVDGLAAIGLVDRVPHPEDRRAVHLVLSDQGRQTAEGINQANDDWFTAVFSMIAEDQRGDVSGCFDLLVQAMEHQERNGASCSSSCCSDNAQ